MKRTPRLRDLIRKFLIKNPAVAGTALKVIRSSGFDIIKGVDPAVSLLSHFGINKILDVGANAGQYAMRTRVLGFNGKIISFEPVATAFNELAENAKDDPLWVTENFGLGEYDGEISINVFKHTVHSSILDPLPLLSSTYSDSIPRIGKEQITIRKLDSIFNDYYEPEDRILLKIDTQGYEKSVLEGALGSLKTIVGLHLELSWTPFYEGELPMIEMVNFLAEKGYTLVMLEPLKHTLEMPSLSQGDGMFFRLS